MHQLGKSLPRLLVVTHDFREILPPGAINFTRWKTNVYKQYQLLLLIMEFQFRYSSLSGYSQIQLRML
jgi:hypothetical protein